MAGSETLARNISLRRAWRPFREDFRLVHGRIGIAKMTCIETEEQVHKRQLFNRPIASIDCVHKSLEDYLTKPISIRLRSSGSTTRNPKASLRRLSGSRDHWHRADRQRFADHSECKSQLSRQARRKSSEAELMEWRLQAFQRRLGALFPNGLIADGMKQENFGKSLLHALKLAVEKEVLSFRDRRIVWALATHYADGQAMVTQWPSWSARTTTRPA